jgi:hypothetical protein
MFATGRDSRLNPRGRGIGTRGRPKPTPQPGAFKPCLEALEERRLLYAGALDHTFGINGLVTVPLPAIPFDQLNAVALQSDGKVVVAGSEGLMNEAAPVAARLSP